MSSTPPSSSTPSSSASSSSSSTAAATLSSQDIKKKLQDYVDNRRKYKDYMHDLRTGWQKDFKRRAELDAAKKEAEKKEIVIQKAIRLREKRADAVIRQEKAKKLREQVLFISLLLILLIITLFLLLLIILIVLSLLLLPIKALLKYKEHLARNKIVSDERKLQQKERYKLLIKDLEEESSVWITLDNLDEKINENLFKTPSTTGLVTKYSENHRWAITSLKLQRFMDDEYMKGKSKDDSALANRLNFRGKMRSSKQLMVGEFLDQYISGGLDREMYKESVKKFTKSFSELGIWDDDLEEVTEHLLNEAENPSYNDDEEDGELTGIEELGDTLSEAEKANEKN